MIQGKLRKYSHYFTVVGLEPKLRNALLAYMKEETLELGLEKKHGRFRQVPKRMWCRRSLRTEERAFNINEYDTFIQFMAKYNITEADFDIKKVRPYEGDDISFDAECWTAFPQQEPLIEHALGNLHQYAITASPGFGKSLALDSDIRVPGGWIKMRDVKVGDTVTARDGTPTKVLGVYPQGVTRQFRVTFRDGRSVLASPDHLWTVRWRHYMDEVVMTTEEVKAILEEGSDRSNRMSISLIDPEDQPAKDFLIDPYLLGVLIGDGSYVSGVVNITKDDYDLYESIRDRLPAELEVSEYRENDGRGNSFSIRMSEYGKEVFGYNTLIRDLKYLGLYGARSWEKEIPEEYLEGSLEQRMELIRGLLDTDGTVQKGHTISFSSSSRKIAEQFQYLVRSVGAIAKITQRTPHYTYKGERKAGRTDYRVWVRSKDQTQFFNLKRKKSLCKESTQYSDHLRLGFSSIEEVEEGETQCIMVEHPEHLFITNDFIVTHNTVCSLLVAKAISKRFAVVTKGGYEGRWIPAFYDIVGFKPEEVRSCCGAKAIEKLVKEFKKHGPEETKAIFFSIGGLRDYIKNFEAGKYNARKHPCHDIPPEKLFKFLGIGFKIVDEAHQEIHAHYILDLYTNIKHSLYLTGTLIPQTDFMAKRYQIFLPDAIRKSDEKLNIYARAVEVFYRLHEPEQARFVGPQGSYSHVTYEQWLMKDEKRLKNWLEATYDYVVASWAANRTEETKALLFAATIELCDKMREYFARRFPDMRVCQYKAGDPYDYLVDNDILFATLGKAGTAVDIPDLEQVFMTTAINSGNANIQAFGRLRELKQYPELTPVFHWFTCSDVDRQVEYGKDKRKLLEKRVKGIRTEYLSKKI
ncbi:hypothetical protein DQR70_05765 [Salmonella enterica subsp. enterica serovar Oslo]|nr:hypothetical protein [Salmonella enterica subsp. enterica serovar Oslo]